MIARDRRTRSVGALERHQALFSMLVGAVPAQSQRPNATWQFYRVTGIVQGQTVAITKAQGQTAYSNIAQLYDTNDNIRFISDAPREGAAHPYPQLNAHRSKM